MSPTGRVEVIINRVRASAAGPSPQHALREALARFGGLEDIVLLPDDAATADACLLRGCAVLEGAPTSALGKALSALVDRIDPQAAAARKARSPRRSLLRRSKKRDGHRDPADQVPSTRGRNRSTARSAGARRRRKGGGGGRAVGERLPAPQAPGGPARNSQQPLQAPPPAIQPVNQPVNHPPGRPQGPSPSRSPVIPPAQSSPPAQSPPPAQGSVPGSPCRPSETPWSGEGRASGAGSSPGAVRGPQAGRAPGGNDDRGSGDPPSVPPGTGRHRY